MFPETWGHWRGVVRPPFAYRDGEFIRYRLKPNLQIAATPLTIPGAARRRELRHLAKIYRRVWKVLVVPLDYGWITAKKRDLTGMSDISQLGAFSAQSKVVFHLGVWLEELPNGRRRKCTILLNNDSFQKWLDAVPTADHGPKSVEQRLTGNETATAEKKKVNRVSDETILAIQQHVSGKYRITSDVLRARLREAVDDLPIRFTSKALNNAFDRIPEGVRLKGAPNPMPSISTLRKAVAIGS